MNPAITIKRHARCSVSERYKMSQQPYGNAGYNNNFTHIHTHTHTISSRKTLSPVYLDLDQAVRRGLSGFISSNLFYSGMVAQWVALLSHSKKVLTELGGHSVWILNVLRMHSIIHRHVAPVKWRQ